MYTTIWDKTMKFCIPVPHIIHFHPICFPHWKVNLTAVVEERYLTSTPLLTKQQRICAILHSCHISPPRELNVYYLWKLHTTRPPPSCTLSGRIAALQNNGQMKPHLQRVPVRLFTSLFFKNWERKHQNLKRFRVHVYVSRVKTMFALTQERVTPHHCGSPAEVLQKAL